MTTPTTIRITKLLALLLSASLLGACASGPHAAQPSERQVKAKAMWEERCKTAGEKIHKTVENVEGIYLMKLRPIETNYGNQFKLDDPYGRDMVGKSGYIESFLRGSFQAGKINPNPVGFPPRVGYGYIEAIDPVDGLRYRYTGQVEEPWKTTKSYLEGYKRFVLDKVPATGSVPRYGVTYDDISTHEDREYWIAGSSLKVLDMQTNEVIAERTGYMVDLAQGSQAGGRSPWLFAANNACPDFYRNRSEVSAEERRHSSSGQVYQTIDFVEKVLKPSK